MLCKVCGEDDETKFYSNNKSRCKVCVYTKERARQKGYYDVKGNNDINYDNYHKYFEDGFEERIRHFIETEILPALKKIK